MMYYTPPKTKHSTHKVEVKKFVCDSLDLIASLFYVRDSNNTEAK